MSEKIRITIDTPGPIYQKNGVIGPITKPFLEDANLVVRMVMAGVKITRHDEGQQPKPITVRDVHALTIGTRVINDNKLQEIERAQIEKIAERKKQNVEKRDENVKKAEAKIAARDVAKNPSPEEEKVEEKPAQPKSVEKAVEVKKPEQKTAANDAPKEDKVEKK